MIRKKKLILVSIVCIITAGAVAIGKGFYSYFYEKNNVKLMAYRSANEDKTSENGLQIDKFENIQSVDWINENEILTITQKDLESSPSYCTKDNLASYCSIYNLNTKESKDFKEVNIGRFLDISPNKQYVLYSEPRNIPEVGSESWKKADESGGMFHKNIKMLNLSTGEIADIKTRKLNCNSEYKFISDNKILINNLMDWAIIDISGKIYCEGTYNIKEPESANLAGIDQVKDLGDKVEGKFFYTLDPVAEDGIIGAQICSLDVNTKEINHIFYNKYSGEADESGKTIIIDKYNDNGEAVDGVHEKRTHGYFVLDESGNKIHEINLEQNNAFGPSTRFSLSRDGKKAAYVEQSNGLKEKNSETKMFIKIVDTKTGKVSEAADISNLKSKDDESDYRKIETENKDGKVEEKQMRTHSFISKLCWDKAGTSLIINYKYFSNSEQKDKVNTYVVTFDN